VLAREGGGVTPESRILHDVRLALGTEPGLVLWRNNVGLAVEADGRRVRYGLAPGSADLIGMLNGRFVALEVKTDRGRLTSEQREWLALVQRMGGLAAVVRSAEGARAVVEQWRVQNGGGET
jgi:hypothetical protein